MKIITWVLLLQFCISNISCNEAILSKFHQTGYKLKDIRIELLSYEKEYYNILEVKTFKYNRTTAAINGTMNMKITVKDQVEVVVQARKFLSNEYRHFPLRFQVNLQKAFEANAIGMKGLKDCGNLTSINFEKDVTYHVCNFVIDETQFPPLIPNGRYRVDLTMMYQDKVLAILYLYGEVYIPIPYPKHKKL